MSQQQTLGDFGLQRHTTQNKLPSMFAFLEEKAHPVNMSRNGQAFYVLPAKESKTTDPISQVSFTYTKNVAEKTLVVFSAFLANSTGTVRYTDMRAWQIIVDSWLTAGGSQPAGNPEDLRYLAFHDVLEGQSKAALVKEMQRQWAAAAAGLPPRSAPPPPPHPPECVEFTAATSGENWLTNPWIRCSEHVAAALSLSSIQQQQITVSRAWSIFMGADVDEYHLVVEFASASI
ncbi:hypothetical protein N0V93_009699 [Gnomoniopsis smithogilvyi]|uniref:Uncharacterized protein n=1 Tax=Gnomoniopsis smithogilvyi TaxID=1191159 RepID=A0A9W9CT23_9PEZI|nr:hypothetical protein N0V93_009699 [Gnomoniopsis smithogilvyi]